MEYCVRLLSLVAKEGLLGTLHPSSEIALEIEKILNDYAAEGWELFAVTPTTHNSGFVDQAYHYFRRPK